MGRSRDGLIIKTHLLVYGRSLPVCLHLSEGHASDCREAEPMVDAMPKGSVCLADEDYDSNAILARVEDHGGFVYLRVKRNRRNGFRSPPYSTAIATWLSTSSENSNAPEAWLHRMTNTSTTFSPRNRGCARRRINANESMALPSPRTTLMAGQRKIRGSSQDGL